ncbi:MAG: DUF484 family protein [Gammaproteobacteria bacterium]|nr:DUF484 family protein [Gammaproteobacteria bacterium]
MTTAQENTLSELTNEQVAQYLTDHHDFFQQHPDLFLMMKFSEHPKGSISLVERQMKGLRQRNHELEKELGNVIRHAHDNQQLLQQTMDLTLSLIPAEDIHSMTEILYQQLQKLYDIQYNSLLLDKNQFSEKTEECVDMAAYQESMGTHFPKQQPVCGRLKASEKTLLFGEDVPVNSAAILPLGENGELGLLVLGDEDPAHFDPEMGDLFLLLISDLLGRLLYRYQ